MERIKTLNKVGILVSVTESGVKAAQKLVTVRKFIQSKIGWQLNATNFHVALGVTCGTFNHEWVVGRTEITRSTSSTSTDIGK